MNFDKFEMTIEYPKKPKKVCGGCNTPYKDNHAYCRICGKNLIYQKEGEETIYRRELGAYRKERNKLHDQFKNDALDDVGLLDHPKADEIFEYAWEHGRSDGFYGVYTILCNICHLFA